MSNWPHYEWGKYDVVDAGGMVCIYFRRARGDLLGDDGIAILPDNIPHLIKLLKQAHKNRNWWKKKEV